MAHKPRRWDTKKRRAVNQQRDEWLAVAEWWRNAITCQRLFTVPEKYKEEADFKGPLPWPNEVTLRAAHQEFTSVTGVSMSRLAFGAKFRSVAGVQRVGHMNPARFTMTVSYDISRFRRNPLTDLLRRGRMGALEAT